MLTEYERNQLIESFIPVAEKQAWIQFKKTPRSVTIEELKSAAYLGLCIAASKATDIENFNPFIRIFGEMKDYLRSLDWGYRGHPATANSENFENIAFSEEKCLDFDDLYDKMEKIIGKEAQQILCWRYQKEEPVKNIAKRIGKSSGRVCQIIKKSKISLKENWIALAN